MEQNTFKESKCQLWSVYIMVRTEVYKGRVLSRKYKTQREMKAPISIIKEYLYLNVVKMYKKDSILYIQIGKGKAKEIHKHDIMRVESIQIRKYKRSGIQ